MSRHYDLLMSRDSFSLQFSVHSSAFSSPPIRGWRYRSFLLTRDLSVCLVLDIFFFICVFCCCFFVLLFKLNFAIEWKMATRRTYSDMWHHFTRSQDDNTKAICDFCKTLLSIKGGSTSNLLRHLKLKHPMVPIFSSRKERSRSRSPSIAEPEESDSEVRETSFIPVSKLGPECSSSSDFVLFPQMPSPTTSIWESQRDPLSNTVLTPSPSTVKSESQHLEMNSFVEMIKPVPLNKSWTVDMQVTKMICKELHPFSIVEEVEFKTLLKMTCPGYSLPDRKTISQSLIPSLYLAASEKLRIKLELAKAICISCENWTSINNDSFYAITAHYFDGETKLNSSLIECFDFPIDHTAINLAECLDAKLLKWNIRNKTIAAVTDDIANIKLAISTLNIRHIDCFAHSLNSIMQNSIKVNINCLVSKIKRIVQYFKRSRTAFAKLKETQKNMNKPFLKLKQDVPTRWNSTFDMLNRALSNKDPITYTLALLHCKNIGNIDDREWKITEQTVKVLGIFEEVTREICSEKTISLSKAFILSRALIKQVSQMLSTKNSLADEVKGLLNSLLDGLNLRFGNWESTEIVSVTFFRPQI